MTQDIFDRIRALAMEKLASESEVDAFMEGFGKEVQAGLFQSGAAGAGTFAGYASHLMRNENVQRAGIGLGASLMGALLVKGISSSSNAVIGSNLRSKFELALDQAISTNKMLKGANEAKIKSFAETIFKFAPHIASDPNMLSNILGHVVDTQSLDINIIKTLTDLEGRFRDNNKPSSLMSIKA